MKRKFGTYLCIENEYSNPPVECSEVEPLFDLERGYRKGDVFDVFFDDTDPSKKYPFTLTGRIEYKKYPGQHFEVRWRISRESFDKHLVSLRKAKLEKLNTI